MTSIPQNDRRRFLKGAAVAGGATWVVPLILSTPASADHSAGHVLTLVGCQQNIVNPGNVSVTLTFPANTLQAGDLLIALTGTRTQNNQGYPTIPAPTTPSWSLFSGPNDSPPTNTVDGIRSYVFTRVYASGDATSYTFKVQAQGNQDKGTRVMIVAYRAASTPSIVDSTTRTSSAASSNLLATGIASTCSQCRVVYLGAARENTAIGAVSATSPDNRQFEDRCSGTGNNNYPSLRVADDADTVPPVVAGAGTPVTDVVATLGGSMFSVGYLLALDF